VNNQDYWLPPHKTTFYINFYNEKSRLYKVQVLNAINDGVAAKSEMLEVLRVMRARIVDERTERDNAGAAAPVICHAVLMSRTEWGGKKMSEVAYLRSKTRPTPSTPTWSMPQRKGQTNA